MAVVTLKHGGSTPVDVLSCGKLLHDTISLLQLTSNENDIDWQKIGNELVSVGNQFLSFSISHNIPQINKFEEILASIDSETKDESNANEAGSSEAQTKSKESVSANNIEIEKTIATHGFENSNDIFEYSSYISFKIENGLTQKEREDILAKIAPMSGIETNKVGFYETMADLIQNHFWSLKQENEKLLSKTGAHNSKLNKECIDYLFSLEKNVKENDLINLKNVVYDIYDEIAVYKLESKEKEKDGDKTRQQLQPARWFVQFVQFFSKYECNYGRMKEKNDTYEVVTSIVRNLLVTMGIFYQFRSGAVSLTTTLMYGTR